MVIVASMNVYNEAECLPHALEASYPYVDEYVIADGAYACKAPGSAQSDDGTLDILKDWHENCDKPVTVITHTHWWPEEYVKRNYMMRYFRPGDWILVWDADWLPDWGDETREFILTKLADNVRSLVVKIDRPYQTRSWDDMGNAKSTLFTFNCIMGYKYETGLHYVYNHYTLAKGDGTYIWNDPNWKTSWCGVKYIEMHRKRTPEMIPQKTAEYAKNIRLEMANGQNWYFCDACGYGTSYTDNRGRVRGFKLPRGCPIVCPKCGSGDMLNPDVYK